MRPSRWTTARVTLCVCGASFILSVPASATEGFELIANGDMERIAAAGKPASWSTIAGRGGKAEYSIDTKVFHSGTRSLAIQKDEKQGYCMWRSSYIPITVTKETEADFSIWIKAEAAPYIVVRIVTWDKNDKFHQYLTPFSISKGGFFDWREHKKTIALKPGGVRMDIRLCNFDTGTVWFDDAKLTAKRDIHRKRAKKPAAKHAVRPLP